MWRWIVDSHCVHQHDQHESAVPRNFPRILHSSENMWAKIRSRKLWLRHIYCQWCTLHSRPWKSHSVSSWLAKCILAVPNQPSRGDVYRRLLFRWNKYYTWFATTAYLVVCCVSLWKYPGRNDLCPCSSSLVNASNPPSFVGNDYFCETGDPGNSCRNGYFFAADPLFDGQGCGSTSTCCSFNSPPWFSKQLLTATTDNIEVRVCSDEPTSSDDVSFQVLELYIQ